ncbi:hypothetical protein PFNF54_02065 [Plasmodium falciparum NF54]|uniref:Uncharacterized protein n=1 Tax=Plasmodium falciparum (isolate NF54) TaxID=5843 RepID=W7K7Y2_PLAFO|nr:hypothetical protein PFNF54_02065 [Plasmodium falciparum NF54]
MVHIYLSSYIQMIII